MVNLDTDTVFAFISEGSPVRYQLREYVQGQQMVMTQTAFKEFIDKKRELLTGNREQEKKKNARCGIQTHFKKDVRSFWRFGSYIRCPFFSMPRLNPWDALLRVPC